MTDAVLITPASIATYDELTNRLRTDVDFDVRWAAWQSRGRSHDRAFRYRVLVLAAGAAVGAAVASLLLIR